MPAPYSDNLYSGDDNPWEDDQNEALSPADGYFHASSGLEEAQTSSPSPPVRQQRQSANVPFVPNVMVEDPTLNEDRAAAKAREAAQERLINTSSSSPSSSGHYHRRSIDEEISSFQPTIAAGQAPRQYTVRRPSDAPPAYSPSASSPQSSGYQTFAPPQAGAETMGVPEENQSLLPRQPESMGGAVNGAREPLFRRIRNSTTSTTRKKIRTVLGVLVILSIIVALFGGTIGVSPVKAPPTNNPPPNMSWPPRNSRNCLGEPHKSSKINEVISFGHGKKLSIVQTVERENGNRPGNIRTPNVYGEVILQPVDTTSTGTIQLEIMTNDETLRVDVEFRKRDQQFQVIVPRWTDWSEPNWQPCILLRITVSIPREAELESLLVDSLHLDVAVRDGLVLSSATDAQIKTVAGDVTTGRVSGDVAPYTLASRSIIVETVSGDVAGWFPLYDLLKIHTVSGEIKTDITPKPSSDKKPEQAVLNVDSVSGNIKITEPVGYEHDTKREEKFPPRDYVVTVSSASGDIQADLAFTSTAKFETVSGDQKIKLLPVFGSGSSAQPSISTDTKSGQTTFNVFEPLWKHFAASIGHYDPLAPPVGGEDDTDSDEPWIIIHPDEQLSKLPPPPYMDIKPSMAANGGGDDEQHGLTDIKSHHASISGDFKIHYPASWEGKFSLTTFSGSQDIRGDDLHYKRTGGIIKRIEGTKGNGRSSLTVDSMSGREELVFGAA
ncbi:uncharacterized protein TRIVIDRAFT_43875 [Trichoderma virens Gv29-8]|uniref:DUF4097 domain-containing protein n=1 Tax=Hypocrea virens (strain Gv29-8 / FGSC 10586) TaxID=413071 RepID=G9N323_HYPVG|nr:uncharacterized protein TRIVIDRAFT_43875 [Trichoderma virens Gv29-8]EHK18708.1 hypothetical protein TRIVIDRAFT_43875 [Trichoderma virens Gv29-8]